jgi:hypothetical protein
MENKRLINNIILMSESRSLGNPKFVKKLKTKLQNKIKVKKLSDSYKEVDMKFNEERGSNYKKFKSLNEIELQNLKEI